MPASDQDRWRATTSGFDQGTATVARTGADRLTHNRSALENRKGEALGSESRLDYHDGLRPQVTDGLRNMGASSAEGAQNRSDRRTPALVSSASHRSRSEAHASPESRDTNESAKKMSFADLSLRSRSGAGRHMSREVSMREIQPLPRRGHEAHPDSHQDCFVVGLLAMTVLQWPASQYDLAECNQYCDRISKFQTPGIGAQVNDE